MCVGEARRVFVVRIALMGVVKRCSGECQEQARHDADVKEFLQPPSIQPPDGSGKCRPAVASPRLTIRITAVRLLLPCDRSSVPLAEDLPAIS